LLNGSGTEETLARQWRPAAELPNASGDLRSAGWLPALAAPLLLAHVLLLVLGLVLDLVEDADNSPPLISSITQDMSVIDFLRR
jgi:hypothetical protein